MKETSISIHFLHFLSLAWVADLIRSFFIQVYCPFSEKGRKKKIKAYEQ